VFPAATQKQNAARLQYSSNFLGILSPKRAAHMLTETPVGDKVEIAGAKRGVEGATFVPIDNDAVFTRPLLGKAECFS
jgi:hypothetical protein